MLKSYGELTTRLALDEISLGVAIITLLASGTIVTAGPTPGGPRTAAPRPPARYASSMS